MVGQSENGSGEVVPFNPEAALAAMNSGIAKITDEYNKLKCRLDEMSVFEDRKGKAGNREYVRELSFAKVSSTPEEQIFFQVRNKYLEIQLEIKETRDELEADLKAKTQDGKIKRYDALKRSFKTLRFMERECKWHVEQMRSILYDLRLRLGDIEKKMIGMIQERDRLRQQSKQHDDKMDVARNGAHVIPNNELKTRIAAKYGISVDQVEAFLTAKQVDIESE